MHHRLLTILFTLCISLGIPNSKEARAQTPNSDTPAAADTAGRAAGIGGVFQPAQAGSCARNQISLRFKTGNDDLRGGNDNLNVVILTRSGRALRHYNVNRGKRWPDRSIKTVSLSLPSRLALSDIVGVRLETTSGGGLSGDNWNLDGLRVRIQISGRTRTVFNKTGHPLFRFTGDKRVKEFRFATAPRRSASRRTPAVRTSFDPGRHGWKFNNTFKNIIGVADITTDGLCGGMVYAALDHYFARRSIPKQSFLPAEGTPLQQYLYARQVDSIRPNLDMWAAFLVNPGGARNREVFEWGIQAGSGQLGRLMSRIDRGKPVPLGLWECGDDCRCRRGGKKVSCPDPHQVLAIGYELGRYKGDSGRYIGDLSIFIYDPNYRNQTLTLKANARGNYYYYKEKSGWKRWRAYFADLNYRQKTPRRIRSQPRARILVEFHTGQDDLRGGRDNVNMAVNIRGRRARSFRNVNRGKRWIGRSRQTISRPLPGGVRAEDLVSLTLSTTFGGGIGGDNWDLEFVRVRTRINGRRCTLLERGRPLTGGNQIGTNGTRLKRFTGDDRTLTLRFRRRDLRCR